MNADDADKNKNLRLSAFISVPLILITEKLIGMGFYFEAVVL